MMEKGKAWLEKMEQHPKFGPLVQFVKFGLVGVSNTLLSLGVYWLCFYGRHILYQLSNLISFVISVTNAYYWNSRYVFKNGVTYTLKQHVKAYFKAFASYGSTY